MSTGKNNPNGTVKGNEARKKEFQKKLTDMNITTFILKFCVNEKTFAELEALVVIEKQQRNDQQIAFNHKVEAYKHGQPEIRKDKAGMTQADSGEQHKFDLMYANDLFKSLLEIGWSATLSYYQKTGDKRYFVQIVLTEQGEQKLSEQQIAAVTKVLSDQVYQFMNMFRNVNGTATFNFSGLLPGKKKEDSIRVIKTESDGRFKIQNLRY